VAKARGLGRCAVLRVDPAGPREAGTIWDPPVSATNKARPTGTTTTSAIHPPPEPAPACHARTAGTSRARARGTRGFVRRFRPQSRLNRKGR
jgi:hypothetical protein